MISEANSAKFMSIIDNIAYFGSFMGNAYNIYAQHNGQAGFYIIDDKAALMLMGHYGHLCGKIKNDSELLDFLKLAEVTQLKTSGYVPLGYEAQGLPLLRSVKNISKQNPSDMTVNENPKILDVAHSRCFANSLVTIDDFYSDTCMRIARGYADIMSISCGGKTVSTAGVYSIDKNEAYIAAVATAKGYEGKGCASYLVSTLARKYSDKRVILLCDNETEPFYTRLGFERSGTVMSCKIKNKGLLK